VRTFDGSHRLQPRFLPKDQAGFVTITVRVTAAANLFEKHGVVESPNLGIIDTSLESSPRNAELTSAEFTHLRHEREPAKGALLVECREDLLKRADPYQVAGKVLRELSICR
jgi:hypothetical protein